MLNLIKLFLLQLSLWVPLWDLLSAILCADCRMNGVFIRLLFLIESEQEGLTAFLSSLLLIVSILDSGLSFWVSALLVFEAVDGGCIVIIDPITEFYFTSASTFQPPFATLLSENLLDELHWRNIRLPDLLFRVAGFRVILAHELALICA